ncbi:DUF4430 domain-containing protein [Paenibacillus sp. HW567]|uniref:DUF4430 domain-containing protein n=1 Tax=Paenibacillus sp. HW567 TaxID=1034769 RepID=UPI00035C4C0B|nr:DUF4430 domain-containing protein [Paenibacillus sp. HW567]
MKTILSAKSFMLGLVLLLVLSITGNAVVPAGEAFAAAESSQATGVSSVTEAVYAADASATKESLAVAGAAASGGEVTVSQATYTAAEYILGGDVTSEWQAIGLAQAGYRVPESYAQALAQTVQAEGDSFPYVTDYARIALAVRAIGGDPANFAGYNLLERIYNSDKISGQTLNAPVYALLALDSGSYTPPADAKWNQAKLLSEILSKQNSDGGFALSPGASTPDMTAMTLTALAAHKNDPAALTAGQKAVAWLSAKQDSNGGYGDSSESVAQAIIGLSSYGADPAGAEFTKNGTELVGRLLSFRLASGAFAHAQGGSANEKATEQAFQALVAYNLFSGGKNGKLYDFSTPVVPNPLVFVPLVIEGPEGTLGEGKAYASNALDALEQVALAKGLKLTNPSGSYVTGIGGISAGTYGGYDGWMYAVSRGGEWVNPDVGMKDFKLKDSDRLLVYYAGSDTQLVDKVTLSKAQPREGEAFSVNVTKKTWVWDNDTSTSSPVTANAAGVQVTIGNKAVTTDKDGKAVFAEGLPEGDYTLSVTGYIPGNAPSVAKYSQDLKVTARNVTATLSVEGPQGPVIDGTLKAYTALEALKNLAASGNIPLKITESSFGSYVSGINGIESGKYNGYWSFAVQRGGEWIYPSVGMGDFVLEASDRVLVYYAGGDTQVVNTVQVAPAQPKPGEAFTVTVTQKKWVWNNTTFSNDPVTSPAAGVQVTIGGTTVTTDGQGTASFKDGLAAKIYTLAVTGYVPDSTPKIARYTQSLKVAQTNVTAYLSIEGPQGPVASGALDAYNAFDALQQLTTSGNIPLKFTESSFGIFVSGIDGIENGTYGKQAYWSFAVSRGGEWIYPEVGLNDFVLQQSDHVLVYYTGDNTNVVNSLKVAPAQPKSGEKITVTVEQKKWVFNENTFTSDPVITPAAGVQVTIGGTTATTDKQGIATFEKGVPAGAYTLAVTGYIADSTPSIARYTQPLTVTDPVVVPQPAAATISVIGDSAKGTILSSTQVVLNAGETAYSLLVRQLGSRVASTTSGGSPYVTSIDGLKEFDRGPNSGWKYSVNGIEPGYSAGDYKLSNGDALVWFYTIDYTVDPAAGGLPGSIGTVDITADNTLPLNQVGQTTAVTNGSTPMTAAEAAALGQKLSANTAVFEQEVTPGSAATLKDGGGEVGLLVPAGAVSGTVKISMRETSSSRKELVSGLYTFGPDGTKFVKPVDLSVTVPVAVYNPANLALAWLNPATGDWIPVPSVLDVKTGVITGKISHFTDYAVVDRSKWEPQQEKLKTDIAATAKGVAANAELSDWQAVGLARSGNIVPAAYLAGVKAQLADSNGQFRKVTDYERLVLGLAAAGADPQKFGGYNLIEKIYNNSNMLNQGSNGLIFALIALDSGNYNVPSGAQWTKERLIESLLAMQSKEGGFPLTAGGAADPDITAMAVTALSSHTNQTAAAAAMNQAITWLSQQQQEDGGYKQAGVENSESTAQVIIALSAAGIGPNDSRFVKAKGGLLSHLASFRQADGGYAHTAGQPANSVATEQALLALTAYERYLTGEAKLFSISPSGVSAGAVFADESRISAWALDAVRKAYDKKLMEGVSADSLIFAPKQKITRAEFAALLLRLTGNEPAAAGTASVFSDVKPGAWYYGVVAKAKALGIVDGVTGTTFNPGGTISRQDMAVMISRAFKLESAASGAAAKSSKFSDEGRISSYAVSAVRSVTEQGYMTGFGGAFDPAAAVTREMAAVVAVRLP